VHLHKKDATILSRLNKKTGKLSYSKDDRTMRPIYGCPETFRVLEYAHGYTFAEMFNGLLFRSILWMCIQNLKVR